MTGGRPTSPEPPAQPIRTAELMSVGSELMAGETQDTNAHDLARELTTAGVEVRRIVALPDRLDLVEQAFRDALGRSDLVVSTGGLGPTPDDLTREAVAAAVGEEPDVDPDLERWLRGLYARRGTSFPEANLKQAWRIPSATPLPNPNGTAPGWFVERPDRRIAVLLPGPPREMKPMWANEVLPRLAARGLGVAHAVRTLRLVGIGESVVVERLGEPILRAANPVVATYARADAVDVRISAVDGPGGEPAGALVAAAEDAVRAAVGEHVWAEGHTSWAEAIGAALEARGWTLGLLEVGTRGALLALLGEGVGALVAATTLPALPQGTTLDAAARALRRSAVADVVLAARVTPRRGDLALSTVVLRPGGALHERRLVFLAGSMGRSRAALTAAGILLQRLRDR